MGFRDWMRLALGLEVKASTTTQAIVRGLPEAVWAPRDYVTFSREGYQQNPWVNACETEIARGIAGPQIDLPECRVPVGAVGIGLDRMDQGGAGSCIIIRADQGIG